MRKGLALWVAIGGMLLTRSAHAQCPPPAPTVTQGGTTTYAVNEGDNATLNATAVTGGIITWDFDCNGTVEAAGVNATISAVGRDGPGMLTVCVEQRVAGCATAGRVGPLTVTVRNVAPTITTPLLGDATEGMAYTQPLATTDPAGTADTITWSLMAGPSWLMINPSTGTLSGTPPAGASAMSPYLVTVRAQDEDMGSTTSNYLLNVRGGTVTRACATPNIVPGSLSSTGEGATANLMATLANPSGCTCQVEWDIDCNMTAESTGNSFAFMATGRNGPGNVRVCARATPVMMTGNTCDTASSYTEGALPITNTPPVFVTPATLPSATAGMPYMTTLTARDPSGTDTITWSLMSPPSWLSINPMTGVLMGTPPASAAGTTVVVMVVVRDSDGAMRVQDFMLTIGGGMSGMCRAPTVPVDPVTVNEGSTVRLTAAATEMGGVIEWDLNNDGTFETRATEVTFDASRVDGPADIVVPVRQTAMGCMGTGRANVNVRVSNVSPTVTTTMLPAAMEGTAYRAMLAATDPAGMNDTLMFTATGLPSWLMLNTRTGELTGTPPAGAAGTVMLVIRVSDDDGATSMPANLTITVAPGMVITDGGMEAGRPDAATEAGAEAGTDAGPEASVMEAGVDAMSEAGTDAEATPDAGPEASVMEAGVDATSGPEAGPSDASSDARDGATDGGVVGDGGTPFLITGDGCGCRTPATPSSPSPYNALALMGALALLARRRNRKH